MQDFWKRLVEKYKKIDPVRMERYLRSLAREKGLLQSVFESISEAIVVLDEEKRIVFINSTAKEILGIAIKKPANKPILRYIADPELQAFFKDDKLHTRSAFNTELRTNRPKTMDLQVNTFPYTMEPEQSGVIIVLKDITQHKKKLKEDFQSEKLGALSTLAAGIAHEIGNPLNSIGIHMQLMEKDVRQIKNKSTKGKLAQYIKSTKTEIARLDKMIRTFLTAVRPTTLNIEEHNVNHILENILDFLYYEISEKNIAIEKDYSSKVPLIPLDETQIRQAFFNIIKNSIEAMPEGGQLKAATGIKEGFVTIMLADSGCGIPEENISRIFEPYFTTKQKGTGLGLMIVYKIINDHDGRIEVESTREKGTRMTIFLPIYERRIRMVQDKTKNNEERLTS